uniref:ShKT domain-containing protein n=1 Tax=Brugia timori TaxID=42155 RepID=A0A0R3Q7C9_9BILA
LMIIRITCVKFKCLNVSKCQQDNIWKCRCMSVFREHKYTNSTARCMSTC